MKKTILLLLLFALFASFSPKKILWVAIGDSITYLNNHQNETGYRITRGYMTMVTEQLPHIEYLNHGRNGWTSVQTAAKIDSLGWVKADVYSVFLGTNDWWQGKALGSFSDYENNTGNGTVYGSFRIIVNKIHSLNKDAKIIFITPIQRMDFVYINNLKNNAFGSYKEKKGQMLSQFAEAIIKIGQFEHCEVVDLYNTKALRIEKLVKFKRLKDPKTGVFTNYKYPECTTIPYNPETDGYPYPVESIAMTFDGLHPSDKGYEVMTKLLVKILRDISR